MTHQLKQFWQLASPSLFASIIAVMIFFMLSPSPLMAARDSARPEHIFLGNYCGKTSSHAAGSCSYETLEEFQAHWANCLNIVDKQEASSCFYEARMERKEAREECREQHAARNEVCDLIGQEQYDPDYEPGDFVDPESIGYGDDDIAPNPYFPLVPGTRWVYMGEDEIITVEVLEETIEIDGVTCAVVRDVVTESGDDEEEEDGGVPVEDTLDWFAQDTEGNVWYFGEISFNFEDGQIVDIEGSWKTGEDYAKPGILMPAEPVVGSVYRQEWLLGEAEDMAEVTDTAAEPELSEDNVGDCSAGCLETLEWTPIEADSYEYKYYQKGVGMIQEVDPEDPESTVELIEFVSANE